ncbi:efflux RND transporter periplasmic adaptor subunit [Piscinibacter sp.]|uniref:efflux RND transporter periplasmic adaptor subunit n=1 Tax=Piscinibacter sp. TaxID=1903157 RepID=UPI002CC27E83|nr:efflux RND transporter periplasmic adaptor subunit [Albitalea sp.]HUG21175.1 efflux RND transporter periplasmic adaptor subunit [Albitalea sp.]
MGKGWVMSGVGVAVAIGIAAAVWVGRSDRGQAEAAVNDQPSGQAAQDGKGPKKPDVPLEFTPREVVQPVLAGMPLPMEFSGPLVAPSTAVVRARSGGTLLSLHVGEGSRVKAGQVLGAIDLAELAGRVAERNAMLASAKAQLAQAERTHASNQRLADQQFISPIALESSRSALETARAQVNAARAQLDTMRVGLRDAALVAPIAGVVHKRHVVPGEKLSVEQPVLSIVDITRLELAGSVGTHEVSRLAPGMPVQVQVEGHADAVTGRLARIAPAAEPGTRSIGVTIALANPKETFRAGQYAMGRVVLDDPTRRLTLPVSAIGSTSGQHHVWVIENGELLRRAVITGRRDEREARVEVLQGLSPGSVVLAARFDNLREGAKAVVVARTAPVASASASSAVVAK